MKLWASRTLDVLLAMLTLGGVGAAFWGIPYAVGWLAGNFINEQWRAGAAFATVLVMIVTIVSIAASDFVPSERTRRIREERN